jgi:hypothetical protein
MDKIKITLIKIPNLNFSLQTRYVENQTLELLGYHIKSEPPHEN